MISLTRYTQWLALLSQHFLSHCITSKYSTNWLQSGTPTPSLLVPFSSLAPCPHHVLHTNRN